MPGRRARCISSALIRHDGRAVELCDIAQESGHLEGPKLERFVGVLATRAYLTPLIGLLGTVTGMIEAFGMVASNGGYATVTELSTGIYKSLLTTAAGLVVATPTFVGYSYLSARVNTLLHDMERAGIEVVHMLTDRAPAGGIISFPEAQSKTPAERSSEREERSHNRVTPTGPEGAAAAARARVEILPLVRPYGADDDTVYFEHVLTGEPVLVEGVAGLVLAPGSTSVDQLAGELKGEVVGHLIGDALAQAPGEEAVLAGLGVGYGGMRGVWRRGCTTAGEVVEGTVSHALGMAPWPEEGSAPTLAGTYCAACVLYVRIFDASPLGIPVTEGLAPDVARELQAIAGQE